MEEEEDVGDYDDDFDWDESDGGEEEEIAPPPLQIKGREVDPNAEEEVWDEDFEFGDSSEGLLPFLSLCNETCNNSHFPSI